MSSSSERGVGDKGEMVYAGTLIFCCNSGRDQDSHHKVGFLGGGDITDAFA